MGKKKMNYEDNLATRAQVFKALGHPVRLLIMNLVQTQPRHGEELATILNLNPATISHHAAKLVEAGLLVAQKDQYYQMYSPATQVLQKSLAQMVQLPQPQITAVVEEDAFRAKVLKTFFKHGRITQFPAQQKKWQVILEKVVEEFEPGREYPEQEVNHMLLEFHEDVASLRRGLVEYRLMTRSRGIYRRLPADA